MSALAERIASARARCAPFRDEYPFEPHFARLASGHWLHYLDEGPRAAPVLVCLHGNPSWSFLWRRLVSRLSPRWRVIAPDHLGMGLSDKPREFEYTLERHADHLSELLDGLGVRRASLALHDWGGAIGMACAAREALRIESIIASNTAAFPSAHMPLRIALCRLPGFGALAVRGANAFVAGALRMAVEKPLEEAVRRGLLAPYATWAERIGVHRFVLDIPRGPRDRAWEELLHAERAVSQLAQRPSLLLWGERDWCFTPHFRRSWRERWPRAEEVRLEGAGHYLFEDEPERTAQEIEGFLERQRALGEVRA